MRGGEGFTGFMADANPTDNNPKEITDKDLGGNAHALWLKAQSAVEMSNHKYAVSLLQALLKDSPGFLEARRLLRKSALFLWRHTPQKKKKSLFSGSGGGLGIMKLQNQAKKEPLKVLEPIEKELAKEPLNPGYNELLHDAAMRLNMLETAAFALETVRQGAPENTKLMHKLAEHYMARDMPAEAGMVYKDIVKQDPGDIEAAKGEKDAVARASMKKQKWGGDLREVMRDDEETAAREKEGKTGLTAEQMEARRDDLLAKYEEDMHDLPVVKKLASVYEQLEDWENARTFYQWAYDLSNGDNSLKQKASRMSDRFSEQTLHDLERQVASDPDNEELREKLGAFRKERMAKQVEEGRKRVEQNPTDPQYRYELGLALYHAEEYSEAIPHLQRATRSPHIRTRVLLLLARTFFAKGMNDLAVKQLEDANSELHAMDSTKKEILYELGSIHSSNGNEEDALACFKQIYEVDYGYRDVAKRVEESYQGGRVE